MTVTKYERPATGATGKVITTVFSVPGAQSTSHRRAGDAGVVELRHTSYWKRPRL